MNDEEKILRQLLYTSEQLNREFSKQRQSQAFSRKLCQLGANLKREKDDIPNPLADDCFTAAMEFVSMSNLVKHCQKSEREAYLELHQVVEELDSLKSITERRGRGVSADAILNTPTRVRRILLKAMEKYPCCKTFDDLAAASDLQFLNIPGCDKKMLIQVRKALTRLPTVDKSTPTENSEYEEIP